MTDVCDRCGRQAPPADSKEFAGWETEVRGDGSSGLVCSDCLTRMQEDAVDEGRIWSELERLPPEDLAG